MTLDHVWRFRGAVAAFARAVQAGDADEALALLRGGTDDLEFVETDSAAAPAGGARGRRRRRGRARRGRTAHRRRRRRWPRWSGTGCCAGTAGAPTAWRGGAARSSGGWPRPVPELAEHDEWYPGRPVLVTANDYDTGLYNGDTGVVVATADGPRVAFPGRALLAPSRLAEVATVHAMTVHRGQGSQFARVTVVLPPAESPLLTRELLYTAVTRARTFVRVVGSEAAVRAAVARPVSRASGLRHRLAR